MSMAFGGLALSARAALVVFSVLNGPASLARVFATAPPLEPSMNSGNAYAWASFPDGGKPGTAGKMKVLRMGSWCDGLGALGSGILKAASDTPYGFAVACRAAFAVFLFFDGLALLARAAFVFLSVLNGPALLEREGLAAGAPLLEP
ncbi:hypothetical protein DFH11DRAFT_1644166 [Phellopilus nigrolimitatus]|nr:hypothetical protein DFH11DRAFT_1644166 [Phellopilus nigrolimitatus]